MPACKDAVQDIFVKELRGYKPDPSAKSADVSQVKTFTAPAAPSVPKVDEDISAAVAEYARDDATVTASAGTPAAGTQKVEYYFEEEAAPEPAH
ncbi:ATP synthase complex subunit H-domain-containing protein [Thamnocephalis sphaerospora]|uniref:ATP synthase complex subunit H-domain-containing protein n=1 Tax=Thamnocephalis sphaerospora TaxID=78915 RepID=A0A4P9XNG6_9FUNG|nr:ATP synthase complex subunit H-domain-containing protein [Thamnocephalis sphaerospora]|eukprot:RKP06951.1 ATP synthase complex subunit H-domain-containing protein [Thamnocephalis sphaerospora]